MSLTFCRQRCVLKAEQFFGAKLRRRRRSGDSRPPGALWCGSAADFPPFFTYLFSSFRLGTTQRARMFLICSRSFSLSRPAACLPSATTLLSGSQKWKKESLSPHLFFLARKAGSFSCRRPRLLCGPRPRPRGVTLVPDPDCVFCGNHSLTHARTRTVTLTRAPLTRNETERRIERYCSYGLLGCAQR